MILTSRPADALSTFLFHARRAYGVAANLRATARQLTDLWDLWRAQRDDTLAQQEHNAAVGEVLAEVNRELARVSRETDAHTLRHERHERELTERTEYLEHLLRRRLRRHVEEHHAPVTAGKGT